MFCVRPSPSSWLFGETVDTPVETKTTHIQTFRKRHVSDFTLQTTWCRSFHLAKIRTLAALPLVQWTSWVLAGNLLAGMRTLPCQWVRDVQASMSSLLLPVAFDTSCSVSVFSLSGSFVCRVVRMLHLVCVALWCFYLHIFNFFLCVTCNNTLHQPHSP